MVHEDRLCKGKLVLILRRRPRSRKECFSFQGACIPRGLFLRKDPGVGRAPAQLTVEDEDEGRSILIREVLSLLAPLRHNGQITKGHPTGGSNTG